MEAENLKRCKDSDKVVECSICDRKFKSVNSVHYHMMVHKDLRPSHCNFCSFKFRTNQQRNRHELSVHKHFKSRKESFSVAKSSEISDCYKPVTFDNVDNTNNEDEEKTTSTVEYDWNQQTYLRKRNLSRHWRWSDKNKRETEIKEEKPNEGPPSRQFGVSNDNSEVKFKTMNFIHTSKNAGYSPVISTNKLSIQTALNQTQTPPVKKSTDCTSTAQTYDSGLKPWKKCFEYNSSEYEHNWNTTNRSKYNFELLNSLPHKIQCHHCGDEFFEPHYFDLHLKHWHKAALGLTNK